MIGIAKLELEFALVIVHYFKPHIYIKSVWVEALICIWPPGLMKIKDFLDWTLIYWFHLFFQCGNFCKWIFKRNCRDIYILAWFIEFDLNVHGLLSPSFDVIESRFLFFYTFFRFWITQNSLKVHLMFCSNYVSHSYLQTLIQSQQKWWQFKVRYGMVIQYCVFREIVERGKLLFLLWYPQDHAELGECVL